MVLPPKELEPTVTAEELGEVIKDALAGYRDLGRGITADEWQRLNAELLSFFGEISVTSFERKKTDVTVRLEPATGQVCLFGPKNKTSALDKPSTAELGEAVKGMLGISRS
jgi:hypothetical protein